GYHDDIATGHLVLELDDLAHATHGFGAYRCRRIILHESHLHIGEAGHRADTVGDRTEVAHPRSVVLGAVRSVSHNEQRLTRRILREGESALGEDAGDLG